MTEAHPQKGPRLREALKSKNPTVSRALHQPGLYYFQYEAPDKYKQSGIDHQVKIGAGGLASKKPDDDPAYQPGKPHKQGKSTIGQRLRMYAGHQGITNPRLLALRSMNYGPRKNSRNENVDKAENAMKRKMHQLAKPQSQGGHPGVKRAKGAYTYDEDGKAVQSEEKQEWFLVDWDMHGENRRSTHQAIMQAVGAMPNSDFKPNAPNATGEKAAHAEQYKMYQQNHEARARKMGDVDRMANEGRSTYDHIQNKSERARIKEEYKALMRQVTAKQQELWAARRRT